MGFGRKEGTHVSAQEIFAPKSSFMWGSEVATFSPHSFLTHERQREADGIYHPLMATHQVTHF